MIVKTIAIIRYIFGGAGLAIGFYFLGMGNLTKAIGIVSLTTVGLVGLISFVSHVIFHKQDAKRIGLETANPGFQFEVGFANLAFGIVALFSYFGNWGIIANAALILTFAIYLFQAGILHTWKSLSGEKKDIGHFIRGGLVTFLYSGTMLYFAITAIVSVHF
jgi:hypothetical protein